MERSLVDIWLEKTVREGVTLGFIRVNTRGNKERGRVIEREKRKTERDGTGLAHSAENSGLIKQ